MAVGRLEAALVWAAQQAGRRLLPGSPAVGAGPDAAVPAPAPPASVKPQQQAPGTAGGPPAASHAAAGAALFGGLLFMAGAFPWALPRVFLAFAATALPWRIYYYTRVQPWNRMYLLDFCYAVSLATTAFLCLPPAGQHPGLEAAVYALADGPVSGALLAWQCAWVFHSPDHTVSVLIHLLPGLAMAAHHHLPHASARSAANSWLQRTSSPFSQHPASAPLLHTNLSHLGSCPDQGGSASTIPPPHNMHSTALAAGGGLGCTLWLLAAPLAFYLAWQAAYWMLVQVLARDYIRRHKLDTSYRCLTRRAARANNVWSRIVLKGSTGRRVFMYGLLQLAFTVATLLLFIPTYFSPHLAALWQALKFLVPVYYGCKYQCERVYRAAMAEGVRRYVLEADARATSAAAASACQQFAQLVEATTSKQPEFQAAPAPLPAPLQALCSVPQQEAQTVHAIQAVAAGRRCSLP